MTDQNYSIAWKHLNDTYRNNRTFVTSNMKQIFVLYYDSKSPVTRYDSTLNAPVGIRTGDLLYNRVLMACPAKTQAGCSKK
jgi:hypothetical protein